MVKQSKVVGILNNADQAAQIAALTEDIRDAILEYQVWSLPTFTFHTTLIHSSTDLCPAGN